MRGTRVVIADPLLPTANSALMARSVSSYLQADQWPVFCSSKKRDSFLSAALLALWELLHNFVTA